MRNARVVRRGLAEAGFSLIELLMVVAIMAVLAAVAVGVTPSIVNSSKGRSGASQAAQVLRRAREMAISRRRNVQVTFDEVNNQIVVAQVNQPGPGTTPIETMNFEGQIRYTRFAGVNLDTPDGFGRATPVVLGGVGPATFTTEGSFVDVAGDPMNATIQLGIPNRIETASALTILGTTAAIRQWKWNGSAWIE